MSVDPKDHRIYPVWTTDSIRFSDLDPNDHVNNGAIGEFFEDGRVRYRQAHLRSVESDILAGFVLVRSTLEYHKPLYFPGDVDIGTAITRVGRTSYTLVQGLFRKGECIATAEIISVLVDPESGTPSPISDDLRALMKQTAAPRDPGA